MLQSGFSAIPLGIFVYLFQPGGVLSQQIKAVCPTGFEDLGSSDNKTFCANSALKYSWFKAQEKCKCDKMELGTIDNQIQWDFLASKYNQIGFNGWFWVGGRDSEARRQFVWDDGTHINEEFPYKNETSFDYQTCLLFNPSPAPTLGVNLCVHPDGFGVICQFPAVK